MLALVNSEKCSRCIQTDTPFTVRSHQKMTVSVRFGTPGPLRELKERIIDRCRLKDYYEQSISPVDDTMAEDLIVSCRSQWSEQLSCRWMAVTHVHERGTWQLCHVRILAFPLNISFYLIWGCKFRILRIKKTRTKIGTLRISHTSSRLDLRKLEGAITDKVWWLSRAYVQV